MCVDAILPFIEEKFYNTLSQESVREEYRDRAVARKFLLEESIGMLPCSALYHTGSKKDRFIRIPVNRDDESLQFVIRAFRKVMKIQKTENNEK